jgi:hypothetical protein
MDERCIQEKKQFSVFVIGRGANSTKKVASKEKQRTRATITRPNRKLSVETKGCARSKHTLVSTLQHHQQTAKQRIQLEPGKPPVWLVVLSLFFEVLLP